MNVHRFTKQPLNKIYGTTRTYINIVEIITSLDFRDTNLLTLLSAPINRKH